MDKEQILNTGIQNIATVYGGVRGTTLSSRHNMRHWQTVVDSGIRTIVELRDEDHKISVSFRWNAWRRGVGFDIASIAYLNEEERDI